LIAIGVVGRLTLSTGIATAAPPDAASSTAKAVLPTVGITLHDAHSHVGCHPNTL
jgi:hypothetical protein